MGASKNNLFSDSHNQLAVYAKALGHPARIAIIEELIAHKECVCGELVNLLPLSQATVSQHLRELKNAGLIDGNIEGPRVCYCINLQKWGEAKHLLNEFLNAEPEPDCC